MYKYIPVRHPHILVEELLQIAPPLPGVEDFLRGAGVGSEAPRRCDSC